MAWRERPIAVIIAVVVLGAVFFLGVFGGILAERTEALDAYVGVLRIIAAAQTHLERDALRRHDLPRVVVGDSGDLVS